MRIKKVSQTTSTQAQVVDGYSTSTTDSYSANYANNNFQGSYNLITDGNAVKTGRKIDGKDEYVVRVNCGNMPNNTSKNVNLPINLASVTITQPIQLFGQSSNNEYPIMQEGIKWFATTESNSTVLTISTTSDRSRFTCYTEIYYINKN